MRNCKKCLSLAGTLAGAVVALVAILVADDRLLDDLCGADHLHVPVHLEVR